MIKKSAEESPTALKIIHITMIWYRTAISGDTPERIWPVIIPGRETNPTAKREFVIRIRAALKAMLRACIYSTFLSISACSRSAARLIPFMELAKIIPARGII